MSGDTDDKLFDVFYDQLKEHANNVQRVLIMIEQINKEGINKTISCTTTKTKFTAAINKLTHFMSSVQNQTEILIKEVKSIKESVGDHDKELFEIKTNLNSVIKDKESRDKETKEITGILTTTTETLRDKVNKQEPFRLLIYLILSVVIAAVALLNNSASLIKNIKGWFIP